MVGGGSIAPAGGRRRRLAGDYWSGDGVVWRQRGETRKDRCGALEERGSGAFIKRREGKARTQNALWIQLQPSQVGLRPCNGKFKHVRLSAIPSSRVGNDESIMDALLLAVGMTPVLPEIRLALLALGTEVFHTNFR